MPLESATYISQLNSANPPGTDLGATLDDHIRLIKAVLQAQFPNLTTNPLPVAADSNGHVSVAAPVTSPALTVSDEVMMATSQTLNDGSSSGAGTLTNAPSAGNPTKWIKIIDNGTTRWIPTWT